ncbi:Uncharacterised protein [Mycobacteroides abscessus subsp. abscessus]|nr:Uncharacterised protein [Mycobacteroides abscessus subsp. abscessus]
MVREAVGHGAAVAGKHVAQLDLPFVPGSQFTAVHYGERIAVVAEVP